ncbi:MAG TPA: hypothetical protein VGE34_00155 [Candidatus Saccharimonadales bacterium]
MRAIVIYKEDSEHGRVVSDYLRDFTRQTGRMLETIDPDTKEGSDFAQAYDIVEYPSVIALSDDGQLQNFWKGLPLPTISEVSYYA